MEPSEVLGSIRDKFGDQIEVTDHRLGEAEIVIDAGRWPQVGEWLAREGGFSFLSDLCAVDWPGRESRFDVVYTLTDMERLARLRVKVRAGGDEPTVPSVTAIWPTANWHEREAYDMFGIAFDGHPDLRRILMPDEWEGHPLRKDYAMGKVPVEYKHLSPGF
jgi:NADH-quinone oxidoreductase subunit C